MTLESGRLPPLVWVPRRASEQVRSQVDSRERMRSRWCVSYVVRECLGMYT